MLYATELGINFEQLDYSFTEGVASAQKIKVQFRRTQNPFNLTLYPVSHTDERFHVETFIGEPPHRDIERATSGEIWWLLSNMIINRVSYIIFM